MNFEDPMPPRFWFGVQPELSDKPAIYFDDPQGGDPHVVCFVGRVYRPELLHELCARANGEGGAR